MLLFRLLFDICLLAAGRNFFDIILISLCDAVYVYVMAHRLGLIDAI